MTNSHHFDPALRRLEEVIHKAEVLGVAESVTRGLKDVEHMIKKRDEYCESMTSKPSEAMQGLIRATFDHPWKQLYHEGKTKWNINPMMLSGNLEGYTMKFLVNAAGATKILDIGLFTGCSALSLAEVIPDGGKVVSCESDPYLADLASTLLKQSKHGSKIQILIGDAVDTLQMLAEKNEKFDFIFIDADRPSKCNYFNISINDLLADGGTIALDNALSSGQSYLENSSDIPTNVNDIISSREDIYHVLLPIRDGVMLVRRKEDMDCISLKTSKT